jgi:hypothetical protein
MMRQLTVIACVVLSVSITKAQTAEPKQPAPAKTTAAKAATSAEAELELKERRSRARSLLIALSSDARTFSDQTLRARSLARIADALWPVDAEQARSLFRKAWEAAEVADLESGKKLQEEIQQQKSKTGGGYAVNLPPNVRREVLKLAARHDRVLGEEFFEKLKTQKNEEAALASQGVNRLNDALSQRLLVATELLESGDSERALQIAEPALSVVGRESLYFLTQLREKNPSAADTRYNAMLTSAAGNPQSDANTVSLLSSYIFTPGLYINFSANGVNTSQMTSKIVPANVTPELRMAFFQAAAAILLRPLPAPGADRAAANLDGKYLVIKRLLPFFEQSAPAEMVESLRGHLNALNAIVSDETRRKDDDWINKGVKPEKPAEEREQALLDRLDRARTSAERDSLYIQLANLMSGRGDMRAREFASKVEDTEVRKQFQAYIDGSLAMYLVEKKLTDEALELAHKGELTHLQKAWVLTRCANLIAKSDQQKALDLVDEAATEARRIEGSDPSLPQALIAVANALKVIDAPRAWDAAFDAVKAANSAEGFSGEDGELVFKFQAKSQSSIYSSDIKEFDLEGIFRDLADLDYDRAVELARGFQGEGPRAVATIAIARAVLEPKKTSTAKRQ